MFLVLGLIFIYHLFVKHEPYELDIVEGLDDYFHAIDAEHKQHMIDTENYYINKFGIYTFEAHQFERLKNSPKFGHKFIVGVPTYRILDNNFYRHDLQFYPPHVDSHKEDREL